MYNKHNLRDDLVKQYGETSDQVVTFDQIVAVYYATREELQKKDKILAIKNQQINYMGEGDNERYESLKNKLIYLIEDEIKKDHWKIRYKILTQIKKIIDKN